MSTHRESDVPRESVDDSRTDAGSQSGAGGDHSDMAMRGVTRPMAQQELKSKYGHHQSDDDHSAAGSTKQDGGKTPASGDHHMTREQRLSMLHDHHRQTLWIYWTILILGVWQLLAPYTFGYLNESLWVDPSGGRGVWLSDQTHTQLRAWLMTISDLATGSLLLVFGWRSLRPNRPISLWICCFIGMWLTLAPVLFWAPTAASYLNDTIVGMLLIALTILIPGMPNMIMFMQHGPATPPGWSYNPSSWPQRWIMIVTGFAGLVVSRYLAAFQLGYIEYVWDPFFGFIDGTEKVLNSNMSHMWPISDAGLGGVSYTFEFLMGYMGSPARWRTMPWMVTFFGVLVIPLGLTHIVLVISQPVVVHAWCTFCLLAALIMLPMIPLEVDEVVAMGQHLKQAKKRGDRGGSLWAIFWKGGKADGCTPDERSPELMDLPQKPRRLFRASIWGMSFPWTLTAATAIGVFVMAAPAWFDVDIRTAAADIGHLGGALVVTVSVVSMGEVVRIGRYLNVLLGLAIAIGPWLADPGQIAYAAVLSVAGVLVTLLSVPRGVVGERYGAWDRLVI